MTISNLQSTIEKLQSPMETDGQNSLSVRAALCVDSEAFDRFGRVLRHLAVGLIDQAIQLRLLSSDPRVERLTLGPVQTLIHPRIGWPVAGRRLSKLLEALSQQQPTVIHALSHESYQIATTIAGSLDADLVLQVSSLADCDRLADTDIRGVGRFIAFSKPIMAALENQLTINLERIDLIRPGVLAAQQIACFAQPQGAVTMLCTSPFERDSGVERVIEAVALLKKRGQTVLLFLLGQGRYESTLRRLVRERDLSPSVTFSRPMSDPTYTMRSADVFVRPSADTAFTDDSLQAMGVGMAVVACPSPPVCDHLRDGETAVVCSKATAAAIADAVEHLMTDRAYAQRIAKAAMEYVRTHHSMSGMAERIAAAYRALALARATFSIRE